MNLSLILMVIVAALFAAAILFAAEGLIAVGRIILTHWRKA